MSQINANSSLLGTPPSTGPGTTSDAISDLDLDQFLNLIIAELQNQDPLNPLENDQLLAQISQIREVGATDRLTETLDAVLLGQNVTSATSLIGADVEALTASGDRVVGNVGQVTINNGEPALELDIDVNAVEGGINGNVPSGQFIYEVVSTASDGVQESFVIGVDTAQLDEFSGSVQINNLPNTPGQVQIFRSDATGQSDRRLVATISGNADTFTDTASDGELGAVLSGPRRSIPASRSVSVTLNNIATITPPAT